MQLHDEISESVAIVRQYNFKYRGNQTNASVTEDRWKLGPEVQMSKCVVVVFKRLNISI